MSHTAPASLPIDQSASRSALTGRIADARALFRRGHAGEAQAICADVLRGDPGFADALLLVADIAFDQGVSNAAIDCLRGGVAAAPGEVELVYKLGCLLEEAGDLSGALDAYDSAVRLQPEFAKAHNNRGAALQKMGRMDEALQCFEQARQLAPGLWQAHYNLGNWHKLHGRLDAAVRPFQEAMRLRRNPGPVPPELASLFAGATRSKLLHDIEQTSYLLERGLLPERDRPQVAALRHALSELEPAFAATPALSLPPHIAASVAPAYNRLLHFHDAPHLAGPAVNPRIKASGIEADYARNAPGIAYADDFLTPEALASLRRFCLESTIWFDFLYADGYLGASLEEGFICPLLAQIAAELPRALPGIFGEHRLTHLWGYKYDSQRSGINEHADFAAVNVNFWLAPDDANLDPDSGGLVIWDKEAPLDWDFNAYNQDTGRIRRFLEASGAKAVTVPHRQNRVVIFNSDLFHKTDSYRFREGYENRRLNVTFLYGYRQPRDNPLQPRP